MEETNFPIKKLVENTNNPTQQKLYSILSNTLSTALFIFKRYSSVAQEIISSTSESLEIAHALIPSEEIAFQIALDAALSVNRTAKIKENNRIYYQKESSRTTKILLPTVNLYQKIIWQEASYWQQYQEAKYLLKYLEQCNEETQDAIFDIFGIDINSLKKDIASSKIQQDKVKSQLINQLDKVPLNEESLYVRYLQHIFLNSIENNAGHVAFAVGHLIYGYSLAHTTKICEFASDCIELVRNIDSQLDMLKKRTLEKIKRRFNMFIIYKDYDTGNFETVEDNNTIIFVKEWCKKFTPWQIECPISINKNEDLTVFSNFISESLKNTSNINKREIYLSHIFICPDCFEKLVKEFVIKKRFMNGAKPIPLSNLGIPKFQVPEVRGANMTKTDNEKKDTSGVEKERFKKAFKNELTRFSKACQSIEKLLIFVDGKKIDEFTIAKTAPIKILVEEGDLIEVMTNDKEGLVLLASFLCTKEGYENYKSTKKICMSAPLENGCSIVFNLDPLNNDSGEIPVFISYESEKVTFFSAKSWMKYFQELTVNLVGRSDLVKVLAAVVLLLCIIGVWHFILKPANNPEKIIKDEKPLEKENKDILIPEKQKENTPENVKQEDPSILTVPKNDKVLNEAIEISDSYIKITKSGEIVLDETANIDYGSVKKIVSKAISQQPLEFSKELLALEDSNGVKMGSSGSDKNEIEPISPVATYIQNKQPIFNWKAVKEAAYYDIYVYESNREISNGRVTKTSWKISTLLEPGVEYSWQVIPRNSEGISIIPADEQVPEPRFIVLEKSKYNELVKLKKAYSNSYLLLGYLYLQYNLREDAEREFLNLYKANPNSKIAKHLVNNIRVDKEP